MKKLAVTMLIVGLVAGAADADMVVFSGATYDVSISDPVAVGDGSESLLAFTLTVTNTTGDPGFDVSAFDGGDIWPPDPPPAPQEPKSTYGGIMGILHQHYSATFDPPPEATSLLGSQYSTAIDTHFLFTTPQLISVAYPAEDVSLAPSAEATDASSPYDQFADTDFGEWLRGVFAATAAPTMDLAYIVVPDGSVVTLDFFMSGREGGEYIGTSFPVPVPEPASMSLLALGGLALLRRRRS